MAIPEARRKQRHASDNIGANRAIHYTATAMTGHCKLTPPAHWQPLIRQWCRLWHTEPLADSLKITINPRLRASVGRCTPGRGRIHVAAFLLHAPEALVHEVLCHEVAHAAVLELYGEHKRPHGPEWRELMRRAGFTPRTTITTEQLAPQPAAPRRRARWSHRCPTCHMQRLGGRPVPQWRCAECRSAGLEGILVITRIPDAAHT